jgi:putative addiction module component (TIGR02574 family)
MTKTELQRSALELPPTERQELVEALWESLETEPAPLPTWQRDLLDERMAELERRPESGTPWAEVDRRVWSEEQ